MGVSKRIVLPTAVAALGAGAVALAGGGTPPSAEGPGATPPTATTFLVADLTGQRVVVGGRRNAGNPIARGAILLMLRGDREVCFSHHTSNIEVNLAGAHIHRALAGSVGPAVFEVTTSGRCTSISKRLHNGLRRTPERYYVDFHSTELSKGAIRGQLSRLPAGS